MTSPFSRISSWLRGEKKVQGTPKAHILKIWKDTDIPRYPPFMKGLPVVPVDKILHTQTELIQRIRQSVTVNDNRFDRYYQSVIQRFCDYVHLLPASQSHHHRGAGGLFRHSLEAGLYALQAAERVLVDLGKTPAEHREMEPRWQLAVFLGALCHDVGKPVTDLSISSGDRTAIWKPIKENLYTWADRCSVDAYFLNWREGRGRQHTSMANLVAERIIGTDSLVWLEEGGLELVLWLMESLNSNPSAVNPVHGIVIQADQASVERDLKTIGATMAGYDIGVPVERLLIDVMHRLVKEGIWQINEPGARVWKLAGDTYVIWPAGGEDMARVIRTEKIPGLARTAEGILDMLMERSLIHVPADTDAHFWHIIPASLKQKIPDIRLQAIRLKDDSQVSSLPLQQVEGIVCGVNDRLEYATEETNADTGTDTEITRNTDAPVTHEITDIEADRKETTLQSIATRDSNPAPTSRPIPVRNTTTEDPIQFEGEAGRILLFLSYSLQSGKRQWGSDAWIDGEGYLLVKWPDALHDFDLPARTILEELSAQQWLWVDPITPWKKVVESRLNDETVKTIRIGKAVSRVFVEQLKLDDAANSDSEQDKPRKSGRPKSEAEFPIASELFAVLRTFERDSLDENGWSSVDRKLLSRGIREAGYRCTIVFLSEMAKKMPEHFSLDGQIFRWRR